MTSRERVLATIRGEEPDRVSYCELGIDRSLEQRLMGWGKPESQGPNLEPNIHGVQEAKEVASFLKLDNIRGALTAPIYMQRIPGKDGRLFYGGGMILEEADLPKLVLPDPYDDALYADAKMVTSQKEDYCCWFVTRLGISATMLSMGMKNFGIALFDNRDFVERVLDRYCDWAVVVAERMCQLDFDVYVTTDDMAFKSAPFFSPKVFRELVLPRYKRLAEKITIPWIIHTDGNILPFLDDLLDLGIAGLHPIQKGSMDIRDMKKRYGDRLCLLGNVDLNILGIGTQEDVRAEVRALIKDVGPGGGYIVTSGNSLAAYLKPENVIALSQAVQEYGQYPINL